MKIGIVGSRRRQCEEAVRELVRNLPAGSTVVSGGCRGVDSWAEDEAVKVGLAVEIHRPQKEGTRYVDACRAYSERNRKIAESADILYAFVASDRKGGTEQTIRFARKAGAEVRIL